MSYYNFIEKNSCKVSLGAMDHVLRLMKGQNTFAFKEKLILGNYNKKNLQ